jgi:hypothetical protein
MDNNQKYNFLENSDIFDLFFYNLSIKVSETYFLGDYKSTKVSKNKYKHETNIEPEIINKILIKNIPNMTNILSKNLKISNVDKLQNLLNTHFTSVQFKNKIADITNPFYTDGELSKEQFMVEYGQFIQYTLTSQHLKDKMFDLKSHDSFQSWLISKKETVLCGLSLVIFLLSFTFYVFLG